MQTSVYKGIKNHESDSVLIDDFLVVEAPLEIQINQTPFTVVMRTPGNDAELVRGLLFAEDIYKHKDPLEIDFIAKKNNGFSKVNVTISITNLGKGYLNKRSLLSVSSCGICGKQQLDDFTTPKKGLKNKPLLDLKKVILPLIFPHLQNWLDAVNIELETGD